ncbi:hypothetical protein BYT27DRAFT_7190529 [Phlegmacium glaucopus]|nr:hypothetical protein BYT27DRAFT_7190529 [Phlegmacium glaucopus]
MPTPFLSLFLMPLFFLFTLIRLPFKKSVLAPFQIVVATKLQLAIINHPFGRMSSFPRPKHGRCPSDAHREIVKKLTYFFI